MAICWTGGPGFDIEFRVLHLSRRVTGGVLDWGSFIEHDLPLAPRTASKATNACGETHTAEMYSSPPFMFAAGQGRTCAFPILFFVSVLLGCHCGQCAEQTVLLVIDSSGKEE